MFTLHLRLLSFLGFFCQKKHVFIKKMGKIIVKGAPKWMDIFFNCIFVYLKNHKGNIIVWIVTVFFAIFSISYKVYMLKTWHKSKKIKLHVQSIQTSKVDHFLFFSNVLFFYQIYKSIPFENWKGFQHWWLKGQKDLN